MPLIADLDALFGESNNQPEPTLTNLQKLARIEQAQELLKLYNEKQTFSPGDVVIQRPGLDNRTTNMPLVVVKVLEEPVTDSHAGAGTPYFHEPLDIVCARMTEGTLLFYHYDSHRLQHFDMDELEK